MESFNGTLQACLEEAIKYKFCWITYRIYDELENRKMLRRYAATVKDMIEMLKSNKEFAPLNTYSEWNFIKNGLLSCRSPRSVTGGANCCLMLWSSYSDIKPIINGKVTSLLAAMEVAFDGNGDVIFEDINNSYEGVEFCDGL